MKYGTYNITIQILAVAAATLLLVPLTVQAPAQIATAQSDNNANLQLPQQDVEFDDVLPAVTPDKVNKARQIALANTEVTKLIAGESYTFMGTGVFTYNIYENNPKWYYQINIRIGDEKQIVALVDLENQIAFNVREAPIVKLTHNLSFATDYYSGAFQINGIRMLSGAPNFTPSGSSNDITVAFLVNGVMTGSTDGQLCNPNSFPSSYWMQTGFEFHPMNDATVVWTDTLESCGATVTDVPYVDGGEYRFTVRTVTDGWRVEVLKLVTGEAFAFTRTGQDNFTMKTNDWHTSVFLENQSDFHTWDNQFTNNPWAQAWVRKTSDTLFSQWDADQQEVRDCDGVHPDNVISGSLSNGGTATWDRVIMADQWEACP